MSRGGEDIGPLPKGGGKSRRERVRPRQGGKSRKQLSGRRGEAERDEGCDGGVAKGWMETGGGTSRKRDLDGKGVRAELGMRSTE